MNHLVWAFLIIAVIPNVVKAEEKALFPVWEVSPKDEPNLKFRFSVSNASAEDPVVISIDGRELKKEDREYRTSLQRAWLANFVPENYKFERRQLIEIPFKRDEDSFGAADCYQFKDPTTGQIHEYFIYVRNWPYTGTVEQGEALKP